jgi:hypothetical protein
MPKPITSLEVSYASLLVELPEFCDIWTRTALQTRGPFLHFLHFSHFNVFCRHNPNNFAKNQRENEKKKKPKRK